MLPIRIAASPSISSAPGGDLSNVGVSDNLRGILQQNRVDGIWDFRLMQGTSSAAAHVAGAVALLRARLCLRPRGRKSKPRCKIPPRTWVSLGSMIPTAMA